MISFVKIKDKVASFSIETFLKSTFNRYGEMLDFNIDSENKNIFMKVKLKGEPEPITFSLKNYSFTKESELTKIQFEKIEISKEWMDIVAKDFFVNKRLTIPSKYSGIIKMLL